MDYKQKILVAGDVRGQFKQLFTKIEKVNKKSGPFDFLLCVGDFFAGDNNDELIAYKNGNKSVPVPTYILGPTKPGQLETEYKETENGEICTNLTYLGKRGLYTASSGVKIAYLSGVEGPASDDAHFDMSDVELIRNACLSSNMASDFRGVDILMTSQWPKGVEKAQDESGSSLISWLSTQIRPRYHFCGRNGVHHEHLPFRVPPNECTELQLSTRFISLAELGSKSKNIYALNVTPVDKMKLIDLIQKTTDETDNPYGQLDFSKFIPKRLNPESNQFFFDMNSFGGERGRKRQHGDHQNNKRPPRRDFDQEKCWFCLSSPNVEKHLVISIGDNFYLALAKGPLNEYHVLILSVTHIQSASLLSQEDFDELEKFKEALRQFFKSKRMTVCFFERNYKSPHMQVNAVAMTEDLEWQLKNTVEEKAEEYNLQFETVPKLTGPTQLPPQGPYFVVELPEDKPTYITRQMKQFPLHFGRDIFCAENLLNCEDKVDWKQCSLEKEQEEAAVKKFREEFKPFDFTL